MLVFPAYRAKCWRRCFTKINVWCTVLTGQGVGVAVFRGEHQDQLLLLSGHAEARRNCDPL